MAKIRTYEISRDDRILDLCDLLERAFGIAIEYGIPIALVDDEVKVDGGRYAVDAYPLVAPAADPAQEEQR